MKYFYLIFFVTMSLFGFSCKGTPDRSDESLYQNPFVENFEDTTEYPVTADFQFGVQDFPEYEYFYDDEPYEISQDEITNEILNDEMPVDFLTTVDEEETAEPESVIEVVEEPQIIEEQQEEINVAETLEDTQITDEVVPVAQQEIPSRPPAQTQQPVQPAQPPAQTQPIQPVPIQPQQPVPVPPELLGSAQEIRPLQRGSTDTSQRDVTRTEPQAQIAVVPQELQAAQNPQVAPSDEIIFSRLVRATVGQIIEIPFRGTGWVYLGELASRRGIAYDSRRLDSDGQSFIFRAEEAGTYALKFFRQDFIRDYILNDHVQVIVSESPDAGGAGWFNPPVDRGRVTAQPRWPSSLEAAEIQRGGTGSVTALGATSSGSSSVPPSGQGTQVPPRETTAAGASSTEGISSLFESQSASPNGASSVVSSLAPPPSTLPDDTPQDASSDTEIPSLDVLQQRAKELFDRGNVAGAIALLDQFGKYYYSATDEIYWLYGQFYEANSPSRNILSSLDYYHRLVNEFPQSSRYNDARSRIAYLERFYINIR